MRQVKAYEELDAHKNGICVVEWNDGTGVLLTIKEEGGTTTHYMTTEGAGLLYEMLKRVLFAEEVE